MARKKELLEQKNQAQEALEETMQQNETELAAPNSDVTENISASNTGESELNELLCSMDQEPPDEDTSADSALSEYSDGETSVSEGEPPAMPKRTSRKKKTAETEPSEPEKAVSENAESTVFVDENSVTEQNLVAGNSSIENVTSVSTNNDNSEYAESLLPDKVPIAVDIPPAEETPSALPTSIAARSQQEAPVHSNAPVLTIRNRDDVTTETEQEDITWHEIRNAYRTRRILTGKLGGIEQTDNHKTIAIVDYKGFRIVIPLKEMMIQFPRTASEQEYSEMMLRQNKILNNMLGADIDFIVRGIDSKTYSVVASRREAMLRKRQVFYLDTDLSGAYRIYEGRIVQARVIAVAEKVVRVEVFGVETSIMARDLAWDWIGDAHERFSVGDEILVRVQKIRRDSPEELSIRVDIKSISQNTSQDNLQKCRIQSKYVGKVTDVHKGVVYIRLSNGVNAVAHSCYDYRMPGKKDEVSFAVTRLDMERGVAVGIITRIIRQNL